MTRWAVLGMGLAGWSGCAGSGPPPAEAPAPTADAVASPPAPAGPTLRETARFGAPSCYAPGGPGPIDADALEVVSAHRDTLTLCKQGGGPVWTVPLPLPDGLPDDADTAIRDVALGKRWVAVARGPAGAQQIERATGRTRAATPPALGPALATSIAGETWFTAHDRPTATRGGARTDPEPCAVCAWHTDGTPIGGIPREVLGSTPTALASRPGGTELAVGTADGRVLLFTDARALLSATRVTDGPIAALDYQPDAALLAVSQRGEVVRRDPNGTVRTILQVDAPVTAAAVGVGGVAIATATDAFLLPVDGPRVDLPRQPPVAAFGLLPGGVVLLATAEGHVRRWAPEAYVASESPAAALVAVAWGSGPLRAASTAGEVWTWTADGALDAVPARLPRWHARAAVAGDGTLVYAGSDRSDASVGSVWAPGATSAVGFGPPGATADFTAAAAADAGTAALAAGRQLWRRTADAEAPVWVAPDDITALSWSPARVLAVGLQRSGVTALDAQGDAPRWRYPAATGPVAMAWGGARFVAVFAESDGPLAAERLVALAAADGAEQRAWTEGGRSVAVALSPTGRWLARATADGALAVYDVDTGAVVVRQVAPPVRALTAGPEAEGGWAFAAGGDDGQLRRYDLTGVTPPAAR